MYMEARHQLQVAMLRCCPFWYFFDTKSGTCAWLTAFAYVEQAGLTGQ